MEERDSKSEQNQNEHGTRLGRRRIRLEQKKKRKEKRKTKTGDGEGTNGMHNTTQQKKGTGSTAHLWRSDGGDAGSSLGEYFLVGGSLFGVEQRFFAAVGVGESDGALGRLASVGMVERRDAAHCARDLGARGLGLHRKSGKAVHPVRHVPLLARHAAHKQPNNKHQSHLSLHKTTKEFFKKKKKKKKKFNNHGGEKKLGEAHFICNAPLCLA